MTRALLLILIALGTASCASPHVVRVEQVGDDALGCDQLEAAISDANRFERDARQERGVTGTNVAAAVFFWPALVGTYMNTEEAIDAAQERQERLTATYRSKGCAA